MNAPSIRSRDRIRGPQQLHRRIGVHVLSEHVFCPRAAILAIESRGSDLGDDDPPLGPRLDGYYDYDEHRFAEAIAEAWKQVRRWLTWLGPAILLPITASQLSTWVITVFVSLPALIAIALLIDAASKLVGQVRTRAMYRAAPALAVDLAPTRVMKVNWWSLRKAGFDCLKPVDGYSDAQLAGRPWRLLVKDTMWRIPVIRKHRGEMVCREQHRVRGAAYCRLIESSEGGRAPFAVLMFANSYECLIIPNDEASQSKLDRTLSQFAEFAEVYENARFIPTEPTDNRCSGCHWGRPIRFAEETILNDREVPPIRIEGISKGEFHCVCGDRFNFVPRHKDIEHLRGG